MPPEIQYVGSGNLRVKKKPTDQQTKEYKKKPDLLTNFIGKMIVVDLITGVSIIGVLANEYKYGLHISEPVQPGADPAIYVVYKSGIVMVREFGTELHSGRDR